MQKLLFFVALFSGLIGCSSFENTKEYQDIWMATQKVFAKNNLLVKQSLYREGTIVAVSKVNGDFLNKARVKVVAKIVEDEEGYLEPAIRVLSQWDNSDAQVFGKSYYQAGTQWINLGSNAAMESKLYNEIMSELHQNPYYSGKAWKSVASPEKELSDIMPSSTPDSDMLLEEESLEETP